MPTIQYITKVLILLSQTSQMVHVIISLDCCLFGLLVTHNLSSVRGMLRALTDVGIAMQSKDSSRLKGIV